MPNYISRLFLILIVFPISLAYGALPAADREGNPLPSLAPMLKDVNPAVVNIATYSTQQYTYNPLLNDPFFRHFFNIPEPRQRVQPQKKQQSAGSGVIVNAKRGIVMTNFHVIKGADEIQVSLIDGRTYQATLLGSDPDLDIAILEIEGKDLTEVSFADSDKLEVGDFVVAIGNPFGLGQTVTTGVVSALGRSGLGIEGYENFIQTDASINPGNSGGALVNLNGELVGINTAIIAPSGGNVGIGFAIPINMAKASMDQIIRHGEVRRGQIGVGIQDITQDLRSAFGLKNGVRGVLISNVISQSPADKAGLKAGDIILDVDGQITDSSAKFRSQLGIKNIGDTANLTVLRENKTVKIKVRVGDQQALLNSGRALHPMLEGVEFSNNPSNNGVKVVAISPRSTAAYGGLRPGDIIVAANRIRVYDINSFMQALRKSKRSVLLQIERNGNSFFVVIR